MQHFSSKEKFLVSNSLNCVAMILQGHAVLIDLRDESSVAGIVDNADGYMNVHLANAVYIDRNGLQYPFEEFMVRERIIRQIQVPSAMNMNEEIRNWMDHGMRSEKRVDRFTAIGDGKKGKRTYKQKRAEERHNEILYKIQRQRNAASTKKQA